MNFTRVESLAVDIDALGWSLQMEKRVFPWSDNGKLLFQVEVQETGRMNTTNSLRPRDGFYSVRARSEAQVPGLQVPSNYMSLKKLKAWLYTVDALLTAK